MNSTPCTVCGEGGHHTRKCPTLSSPLEPGFYKGQVPRGGGGDEDDEHLRATTLRIRDTDLRIGNNPVSIFLHAKNLRIPHQPVVMKQVESFRGIL